jgi:hypothetical protein
VSAVLITALSVIGSVLSKLRCWLRWLVIEHGVEEIVGCNHFSKSLANLALLSPRARAHCRSVAVARSLKARSRSDFGDFGNFGGFNSAGLRRLMPNLEHRTFNVPAVQPSWAAISALLKPSPTSAGMLASLSWVRMAFLIARTPK